MSFSKRRVKKAVSSGLATHRMEHWERVAESLPLTVKRSPTCMVSCGRLPRYFIRAPRPIDLFPTSTNTSLPPLNAQNGRLAPTNCTCTVNAISSSTSYMVGSLGTAPTARGFRTICIGSLNRAAADCNAHSASSSSFCTLGSIHSSMYWGFHNSSGTNSRRYWELTWSR